MAFEHAKNWCASAIIHHTLLEYFGYVVMCMPLGIVGMKREKIITNEHYKNFHWFSCWLFGGVFEHTHLLYVVFGASISGISFLPLAVQSIKAVIHPTLSSNTEKSTILPLHLYPAVHYSWFGNKRIFENILFLFLCQKNIYSSFIFEKEKKKLRNGGYNVLLFFFFFPPEEEKKEKEKYSFLLFSGGGGSFEIL